jgi:hypothetical protein
MDDENVRLVCICNSSMRNCLRLTGYTSKIFLVFDSHIRVSAAHLDIHGDGADVADKVHALHVTQVHHFDL